MSATPWLLRETNPEWRDDHDYTIGSCKRGSNGKIYFALKPSGPNSGGAQNPTTTDGYWVSLADSLKQGGINALLPEEIGAARGSRISATTPATAGWYRIAQSAVSINNCLGLLEITGAASGAHSATLLSAGISYGVNPVLIQHAHVPYSVPGLTKARIVYHKTYSGNYAYLEVYLSVAKAEVISVNMIGGQGWTLLAPSTAGGIPEGYSAAELTFVAGKIVGNVAGSVTGNAGTATKLATARTITLSGDATASGTFDGSGNLTLATTLKNSGATAGSYGPGANATPAFGASFEVPEVTVDAKGRVTSIAERTVKLPAAPTSITGNAGTATKWATKRTVDGVQMDGSANVHHYGACSTAAATAEKAVALTGFVLATGAVIRVKFTVTNTAANPTLNVNATGAKPVYYRGAAITAGTLAANRTYEFVYNGTQYELVGDIDSNTIYTAGSVAPKAAGTAAVGTSAKYAREDHVHPAQTTVSGNAGSATKLATARTIDGISFDGSATIAHYGTCSTEAATAAKVVACTGFALATGSRITVRFTVTNTAANPTLNVNGTGAKAIRYRNAAVSASYLAANRTYDFVYDGTYYQLVGDVDTNTTYSLATATKDGLMAKADKSKLDGVAAGAEVNQNAFSKIVVGSTTIIADTEIDTLTLVAGANITLTPDATNDKVTITAKDTTYTNMAGATASAAGKAGLAPAPAAGAQGKYLRGDGTWQTPPNTTYAVATQSANGLMSATDKKSVDYAEALRLSFIGVPRYWRSTTLPANHVWANGDLVLFSDWPELKKVYDAGGFTGMLLAYNANAATIAANLGKWRPNAANPTGLYVPKLGDQFFRAWTGEGEAGTWQSDAIRNITGRPGITASDEFTWGEGAFYGVEYFAGVLSTAQPSHLIYFDSSRVIPTGPVTVPPHIWQPVVVYLGLPA